MVRRPKLQGRPLWAEVSLGSLRHNLEAIRRHIGGNRKVLAVVKADAYGHGAPDVAKALEEAGADGFGVTCAAEGIELREAGIRKPILVLAGFWPGEEARMLRYRLTPAVTQLEQLRGLERAAVLRKRKEPAGFHLKVDTGMNRLGVAAAGASRFVRALADCPHLRLEGTFTHFASAEVFTHHQTEQQEKLFAAFVERLRAAGVCPGIVHMANSAAIAARPSTWADMVRPGALLYGYHQFYEPPEREAEMAANLPLRPALALRARIIGLRDVPAGGGVGYNARFVPQRASRIAVIPVGYADGLVRHRSNSRSDSPAGRVIVRGRCAPLVGIISMDLAMVDVTDVPAVRVGDLVAIYGKDGCSLYASDVARGLGTVTSDLLCAIGKRVPRLYLP
jgi:alanine racemase